MNYLDLKKAEESKLNVETSITNPFPAQSDEAIFKAARGANFGAIEELIARYESLKMDKNDYSEI